MLIEGLDHPKTLHLVSLLGVERPTAIGYLELLWAFTAKKAPQGNIGKWPDGAIAQACYWTGDPQLFLQSLLQARFIDAHPEHRYVLHDWHDHAPRWVRAKLAKSKLPFVTTAAATTVLSVESTVEEDDEPAGDDIDTVEPTIVATTEPSQSQAKPSQAKGSQVALRAGAAPPAPAGKQPTPEAQMAIALRDLGVTVTSMDLVLHEWVRDGFTVQQAVDAVGIARIRKPHPEPIHPNYIDPILRQPARPPPAQASAVSRLKWRPPPDEDDPGCTKPNSKPSSKH